MAEEEQTQQESQETQEEQVTVSKAQLDALIKEVQGSRKAQSEFDKRTRQHEETIQTLQSLTAFNELEPEQQEGVTKLAEYNRKYAQVLARANNLSGSDARYLATLPWSVQDAEAEKIVAERGDTTVADPLNALTASNQQPVSRGSADIPLTPSAVEGGRPTTPSMDLDRAMDAMTAALNSGDRDKARQIASEHGLNIPV